MVVRLIDRQCLNSKPEPTPVFPVFGPFCLFLDKVNQKTRSNGRKDIGDRSKHICTHMSAHK